MNIYIYDVEVFKEDWIVVAKSVTEPTDEYVIIHNNPYELKKFLLIDDLLLGGFNSKFYDDAIIHAISHGATPAIIKELNDHIIVKKKMWWEFPFLNYKKKNFQSFDLRDDLPINLSLKAIEGNIGQDIVESGVDFRIDRKLTDQELADTIEYCKTDVDNTVLLWGKRQSYIDSKRTVARLKGMDEATAMTMTNAKLTAAFLDAQKRSYGDEMEYEPPKELRLGKYEHVLKFYLDPVAYTLYQLRKELETTTRKSRIGVLERRIKKIEAGDRYDCKLDTTISDVPHTYAWGGIHGAIPNYIQREHPDYKMVTIDVGSYYPSMMIEYDYISRSVPDPKGFADIYHRRMKAKHEGDKATSDALKLVLNTCYGAMKNQYNDLYDPRNASAICITGQLLLTDLIDKLEDVPGYELIQSNTDGIIIRYPITSDDAVVERVSEWERRTRMTMEYTDIHAIAQKDVNNYVLTSGEVYYYEDGKKIVAEEDKNKLVLTGGYVSLAKGGSFTNNSMVVVHDALVQYFMYGVPIEQTIMENDNVDDYQIIAKTGSTYDGTFHDVDGERVPMQNVNRVYATSNTKYGTVYKTKKNGRVDKIASLPDHCIIDNAGTMTIDQIDKSWYIDMTQKRINDYIGKRNVQGGKKVTTEQKVFGRNSYYFDTENKTYVMFAKGDVRPGDDEFKKYQSVTKAQYEVGLTMADGLYYECLIKGAYPYRKFKPGDVFPDDIETNYTPITRNEYLAGVEEYEYRKENGYDEVAAEPIETNNDEVETPTTKEDDTMTTAKPALNIYQKISKVRNEFIRSNVKKTGINRFAEYKYFELADIVPVAMTLCDKYGLLPMVDFTEEYAIMTVVDMDTHRSDDGQSYPPTSHVDQVVFRSPMRKLAVKGMNEIQALGGVETYQRRYLYMAFLDIVEADAFDATNGKEVDEPTAKPATKPAATNKAATKPAANSSTVKVAKSNRPATPAERKETKENLIDSDGLITSTQERSIKNGLKKLRDKDTAHEHEDYINSIVTKIVGKTMTKKEAENVLIEIGEKVK